MKNTPGSKDILRTRTVAELLEEGRLLVAQVRDSTALDHRQRTMLHLEAIANELICSRTSDDKTEPGITGAKKEAVGWLSIITELNIPRPVIPQTATAFKKNVRRLLG